MEWKRRRQKGDSDRVKGVSDDGRGCRCCGKWTLSHERRTKRCDLPRVERERAREGGREREFRERERV